MVNRPRVLLSDEFDLVGVVGDGRALIAAVKKLKPDVVVADISMPRLNGIDALVRLRSDHPEIKVIMLTMHQNAAYARRVLTMRDGRLVADHPQKQQVPVAA